MFPPSLFNGFCHRFVLKMQNCFAGLSLYEYIAIKNSAEELHLLTSILSPDITYNAFFIKKKAFQAAHVISCMRKLSADLSAASGNGTSLLAIYTLLSHSLLLTKGFLNTSQAQIYKDK